MRWLSLMCLILLGACNREPGFDERYDATEKQIREMGVEIDAELESQADGKRQNKVVDR